MTNVTPKSELRRLEKKHMRDRKREANKKKKKNGTSPNSIAKKSEIDLCIRSE